MSGHSLCDLERYLEELDGVVDELKWHVRTAKASVLDLLTSLGDAEYVKIRAEEALQELKKAERLLEDK